MKNDQNNANHTPWNRFTVILFRFFFIFFLLHIFPFPLNYLERLFTSKDFFSLSFYTEWMQQLSVWVGKNILAIDYEIRIGPNGSGDTTADYIFEFIILIISSLGALIWSLIDYKKTSYPRLSLFFRAYVRYYLVSVMFSYGFSKAFTLQFMELSNLDLTKTFGNQSPMGLMWNFMEYSDTYTRFSGLAEIFAGILLILRKTTLLGAIMLVGVMFNVFMMNLSYDIPVKLFSGLLTIMGIYLLAPDIQRIAKFLLLNQTVHPKLFGSYFDNPKLKNTALALKIIAIVFLFYTNISRSIERQEKYGKGAPKSELYGVLEVEEFIKNKDTIPPLVTDSLRWHRIIVDKRYTHLQMMNGKLIRLKEQTDSHTQTLKLMSFRDSTDYDTFSFAKKDHTYSFKGIYKKDTLHIKTLKKDRDEFLLMNRGFHWINEYPLNK